MVNSDALPARAGYSGPHRLFITGVSGGLGRAFAEAALAAGHTVAGTLRNAAQLEAFENIAPGRAFGILLDVTDDAAISTAVAEAEEKAGPLDVLVNNAGYGVEGAFEETELSTFRHQFDVNVFGAVAVTQAILPLFRSRRRGHIIFVTSMGGLRAFPGLSAYHGTKFALEGIGDTLRDEVAHLGIRVTNIEPGSFRTNWASGSMTRVPRTIADYDVVMDPLRERRLDMRGTQLGDPSKAGAALLAILDEEQPPAHLVLGSDALRLVRQARGTFDEGLDHWEQLSLSTDFPDGKVLG